MHQMLQQVRQGRGRLSPAAIGGIAPLKSGVAAGGTLSARSYGGRTTGAIAWRQRTPRISFRHRLAGWRARNWRRAVLAWFVLSLAILAITAEPKTDFPKAQAGSVPAVGVVMRVAGGLTVAGVPLLLIALP